VHFGGLQDALSAAGTLGSALFNKFDNESEVCDQQSPQWNVYKEEVLVTTGGLLG